MTAVYKILGEHVRPLGQHAPDGEAVHQAAMDRKNLPACAYDPPNLKAYLGISGTPPPANTGRVPRGTPCPDKH